MIVYGGTHRVIVYVRGKMRSVTSWKSILLGLSTMLVILEVCLASNSTWDKAREKARIVKKLKKDFRKLKKQDGALKLVGGEHSHEGKGTFEWMLLRCLEDTSLA